ncbi:hypothetical protein Tco_0043790 [Tanacetum coccineum]
MLWGSSGRIHGEEKTKERTKIRFCKVQGGEECRTDGAETQLNMDRKFEVKGFLRGRPWRMSYKTSGGLEVMLKFESTKVMENILENEDHGLRYWIKHITKGLPRLHKPERLAWLRVIGVPIHSWEVEFFKKIAQKWGVVVDTENCSLQVLVYG